MAVLPAHPDDPRRKRFKEAYHHLYTRLVSFLVTRVKGNRAVADELACDALSRGWEALDTQQSERLEPWLFSIAHRLFIDWYRRQARLRPIELEREDGGDPALLAQVNEQQGDLEQLIEKMSRYVHDVGPIMERVLPRPELGTGAPPLEQRFPRHAWEALDSLRKALSYLPTHPV